MSFASHWKTWCALSPEASVVIVTDPPQHALAETIARDIPNPCTILSFESGRRILSKLKKLRPCDLLIALFSIDAYMKQGANQFFSPYEKPKGIAAKYAFIRLDISEESLLQGLSTPKELVYDKISELHRLKAGSTLRVTNAAGTDITLSINGLSTCEHEISTDGAMAFLPPSETWADVLPGKASGTIAVDVTVGQLYLRGTLLGQFGLVEAPVILTIEHGIVTEITGCAMAAELNEILFSLPSECRELVELGHGLSDMMPTGLIGVDESIRHTCHFGIGDGERCGMHLDVVIDQPSICLV